MKKSIQHPVYGEIIYEENAWNGKKTITVNGVAAQPVSKKEFLINEKKATLKGSILYGLSLTIDRETVSISPKPQWYELFFAILPFLFFVTWGNSAALCAIFPVVGGALGGALGGVSMVASLGLMQNQKNPLAKILVGIGVAAVTIFISFLLSLVLIQVIA